MLANTKVSCLYKQRCLWAKKMARVVCRSIETIDKLDCLEKEEAKAEYVRIVK